MRTPCAPSPARSPRPTTRGRAIPASGRGSRARSRGGGAGGVRRQPEPRRHKRWASCAARCCTGWMSTGCRDRTRKSERCRRASALVDQSADQSYPLGMSSWQVQNAKALFSELLDATLKRGPQIITSRGVEMVAVVPIDEWHRILRAARPSLKEVLLAEGGRFELELPSGGRQRRRSPPELAWLKSIGCVNSCGRNLSGRAGELLGAWARKENSRRVGRRR